MKDFSNESALEGSAPRLSLAAADWSDLLALFLSIIAPALVSLIYREPLQNIPVERRVQQKSLILLWFPVPFLRQRDFVEDDAGSGSRDGS
jgi:hypothetical protein